MTIRELLLESYLWANAHAATIVIAAILIPLLGGGAVALTRRAAAETSMFLANMLLYTVMLFFVVATLDGMLLFQVFDFSVLDVNALLLASPLIALGLTFAIIRLVFPLSGLLSVQTAIDLGWFVGGCAALAWFFSKFEGWHIVFFGGFLTLLLFLAGAFFFLRRLGRRAFGFSPRHAAAMGGER